MITASIIHSQIWTQGCREMSYHRSKSTETTWLSRGKWHKQSTPLPRMPYCWTRITILHSRENRLTSLDSNSPTLFEAIQSAGWLQDQMELWVEENPIDHSYMMVRAILDQSQWTLQPVHWPSDWTMEELEASRCHRRLPLLMSTAWNLTHSSSLPMSDQAQPQGQAQEERTEYNLGNRWDNRVSQKLKRIQRVATTGPLSTPQVQAPTRQSTRTQMPMFKAKSGPFEKLTKQYWTI